VGKTPNGQNIIHVDGGANCNSQSIITPEQVHRMDIILGRKPMRGDFIVFYDTGAYEDFFASNANLFPRPARVMVSKDGRDKLVVRREEYTDIFSRDMGLEEMI
jgi:Pyridoxal-dependent decarboxylase, C-terminal sheet domain.